MIGSDEKCKKILFSKKDAAAQDATAIPVVFEVCDGSGAQKWSWTEEEGTIVHAATGMCLQFEESGK